MRTPFVIAEMAGTHDGDLGQMLRGIRVAKDADADAWKTWWTSDAAKTCARMSAPEMLDTYRLGQWPRAWLPMLRRECTAAGLEMLVTVDLPEDIPVVAPFVDRFKVASWGYGDDDFLLAHQRYGKPLVVSTGASEFRDVTPRAWEALDLDIDWLHCVSGYPVPIEDVNLGVIQNCALDGFSDHTKNVLMGALAVAAGARVLEVHFCLPDTAAANFDRRVSHEPLHLTEYVRLARLAAVAMGDGVKKIEASERENVRFRYVS